MQTNLSARKPKTLLSQSFVFIALFIAGCSENTQISANEDQISSPPLATVEISNSLLTPITDQLVSYALDALGILDAGEGLQVVHAGEHLPSQLIDNDGDGISDRLLFLVDLDGSEKKRVEIFDGKASKFSNRAYAEISIKEGGAWQNDKYVGGTFQNVSHVTLPSQYTDHSQYIRYEGPGIETEDVGYRVYLDWRNGFDVFGKKTPGLTLAKTGVDDYQSYHEMADWGADILKVGKSLGMGGFGYWNGKAVELVSDVADRSATILANGPIYSAFAIDYQGWRFDDRTLDLQARLSMTAGSPLVHMHLKANEDIDSLAIGLVDHGVEVLKGDLNITGTAWSYLATYGQQTLFGDDLGMMLLFRKKDLRQQAHDKNNHVLVMRTRGGDLSYYFGALWSGSEDGIKSREALEAWLQHQAHRLTVPPRLRLKTALGNRQMLNEITPDTAIAMSVQAAESEVARRGSDLSFGGFDAVRNRASNWNYTTGLLMQAMDDVASVAERPEFAGLAEQVIGSYIREDGGIHTYKRETFNIDNINSGKVLLRLYQRTGEPKYKIALDVLAGQLKDHPRTSEGAFWHKKRYPSQLWLDGVYMGMPFLAEYSVAMGNDQGLEEAVQEVLITHKRLKDPSTGLYFHAWDEARVQKWANPDTGLSRHIWGRGVGWYAMALVDMMDIIPAERSDLRDPIIDIINELAAALIVHQDNTGTWFQVMDMPGEPGNYREASSSSMFVYFLAKAAHQGILPDTYQEAALRGYQGLLDEFVTFKADGNIDITNICAVGGLGAGRDGSFSYYMSEEVTNNDPKGLAPFIMAGIEIAQMLESE